MFCLVIRLLEALWKAGPLSWLPLFRAEVIYLKYCISVGSLHSDTEVTSRDVEHAEGLSADAQEAGSHLPGISPGTKHHRKDTVSLLREVKGGHISHDDKDCQQ